MYWIPNNKRRYVAPDVLVVDAPEGHPHDVYLEWSDAPPILVVEVGSKSSVAADEGPKVERYLLDFHVNSYVYYDPPDRRLRHWQFSGSTGLEQPLASN